VFDISKYVEEITPEREIVGETIVFVNNSFVLRCDRALSADRRHQAPFKCSIKKAEAQLLVQVGVGVG
jgi:hypothetical protein